MKHHPLELRHLTATRDPGARHWQPVFLFSASAISGQTDSERPAARQPQATFKSGVDLVTLSVAVRTENGRVVRDLQKSDFTVLDAGQPAKILDFYAGDSPISLAILLDISGSMAVGGNMDRARDAVAVATMSLRTRTDEAALFTFDSQLEQVVGFTKDLDRIRRVSLKGTPWGKTSLYDAIGDTATSVSERSNRHRALLVITDGVDTGSRLTAAEVSSIASSIDVPVYLLTVVTPLDHPGTEFEVTSDGRSTQTAALDDLARWTGGNKR
jgi:VWFA-related protein